MICEVLENRKLGGGFHYLRLAPKGAMEPIEAGQFVMVKCGEGNDPLLRRPMSIADFDMENGCFGLLVQIVGRGTKLLVKQKAGEKLDVTGPFGQGFKIGDINKKIWIIAGGTGVAPFAGLLGSDKNIAERTTVFLGARTSDTLFFKDFFEGKGVRLICATEDGSYGTKGFVTKPFEELLIKEGKPDLLLTCGPTPMMKIIAGYCVDNDIECQVSLEKEMACGFGACLGCVVKKRGAEGYMTTCKKGPVFSATEVEF
jgi:dihydroorotate dehydrogenase electron transfer subunit